METSRLSNFSTRTVSLRVVLACASGLLFIYGIMMIKSNSKPPVSRLSLFKFSPAQFVRQVRQEGRKVTWPTRKEVAMGALMVFVLSSLMAVFFLAVDQFLSWLIQFILG